MRLRHTKAPLALAGLLILSACGDTCIAFCDDQTQIQRQYSELRDECRELAEAKSGFSEEGNEGAPRSATEEKTAKTRMVALFSECMNQKGWGVPAPGDKKEKADKNAPPPPVALQRSVPDARAQRAAECAFARQAASSSVIARKRAEACDMECKNLGKIAPEAPKPAACQ